MHLGNGSALYRRHEVVMAVDEVKLGSVLEHFGDVKVFGSFRIDSRIFFIAPIYYGMEVSASHRIPGGEQRHVPTPRDQSFGDVARDSLPRAVLPGRCSLG